MSRFNSFGTFVSGNGGPISYDGILAGGNIGTCAQWLSDHVIIANVQIDGRFVVGFFDVWNPSADWKVLDPQGCNALEAGKGRWAAFTAGRGVFGDVVDARAGLSLQNTDQRGAAGPDGTLATVPDYQVGTGLVLHRLGHSPEDVAPGQVCRDVQILNGQQAVWNGGDYGIDLGAILPGQRFRVAGGWVSYYNEFWGVVAHHLGRPEIGLVIGQVAFHHDIVEVNGSIRVGYSTGVQERPDEWRVVDVLTLPLVDLTGIGVEEPIVEIGRPLWLGWFEFTNTPQPLPPGNALLMVKQGGPIVSVNSGEVIAQWVQGDTVESIEAQAAQVPSPVAYLDARQWPRVPVLPAGGRLALQAYCWATESPQQFEVAMRAELAKVPSDYDVALVCQCYTSNLGQTKNLSALVPVYARLALDFPRISMLLSFSDQGRPTGLVDHPEVRPRWQSLFDGILGEPGDPMPPPNVFPIVQQLAAQHPELVQPYSHYPTPEDASRARGEFTQRLFSELPDQEWGCVGKTAGEAYYVPPGFEPRDVNGHHIVGIAESVIFHRATNWQVQITASGGGAAWMEIPQHEYRPQNPWLPEEPWETDPDPDPDPKPVNVLIFAHDAICRRSDPNGCLVRFEVESARPVTHVRAWLEGSSEAPVGFKPDRDGRFDRAHAWKFGVPGTYPLIVEGTNDQGEVGRSDGTHRVTVVD